MALGAQLVLASAAGQQGSPSDDTPLKRKARTKSERAKGIYVMGSTDDPKADENDSCNDLDVNSRRLGLV